VLYLTRAATRVKRGKEVPRTPSRFLEDIPAEVLDVRDLAAPPPGPPTEKEKNFFANLKERFKAQPLSAAKPAAPPSAAAPSPAAKPPAPQV